MNDLENIPIFFSMVNDGNLISLLYMAMTSSMTQRIEKY